MGAAQSASYIRKNQISRHFGEVLRQYRLSRGWSQSVLSTKSKVDRTYISQIECGIHSPTITVLCRLSRALQVAPSVLVSQAGASSRGDTQLEVGEARPRKRGRRNRTVAWSLATGPRDLGPRDQCRCGFFSSASRSVEWAARASVATRVQA